MIVSKTMHESKPHSSPTNESRFTYDDVATTLEYLKALNNRVMFSPDSTNLKPDLRGISYSSEILDKKVTFTDSNLQTAVEDVVQSWIENAEGFTHIFQTEQGSLYFILKDGKTIRFQKKNNEWILGSLVVMEHIFFLPDETFAELLELHQQAMLQDHIHELCQRETGLKAFQSPAVGLYPFEFRARGYANDISYSFAHDTLRITEDNGPFASGYHLGHKISHVLK